MQDLSHPIRPIRTGSGTDLAFSVMVLAAYFTTFSSIKSISVRELVIIILLGIAYIAMGVYGYSYCAHRSSLLLVMAYFGVQLSLGEAIIYLGGSTGFSAMILLPLAGHSVVLLPELWRYGVNGGIVVLYAVTLRIMSGGWELVWANLPVFVAGQVFILVFTQMAVSEELARNEVQGLVGELETANKRLREYAVEVEDLAVTKERNRLAREIHDGLGHHLTALNMQIKAAKAVLSVDPLKSADLLGNAENLTQKALEDVRHSVYALRDNPADKQTLVEQIESALRVCDSSGIQSDFAVLGEPRLTSPQVTLALSRAAQECVNNALKHSKATMVKVSLDFRDQDCLHFVFKDNGVGSQGIDGGFGLVGMKERVVLLEGDILIQSAKGAGFEIKIIVPG